jgi:hypothetical protein
MNISLDTVEAEDMPLRFNGCIIHVSIHYSNKQHFDFYAAAEPYYTMKAERLPISEFKQMYRKDDSLLPKPIRHVENHHGVLVIVDVSGEILFFDLTHFTVILTTGVGMLALASLMADRIMVGCLRNSKRYNVLKHQPAQFDDEAVHSHATYADGTGEDSEPIMSRAAMRRLSGEGSEQSISDKELLHVILSIECRLNKLDAHNLDLVYGTKGSNSILARIQEFNHEFRPDQSEPESPQILR